MENATSSNHVAVWCTMQYYLFCTFTVIRISITSSIWIYLLSCHDLFSPVNKRFSLAILSKEWGKKYYPSFLVHVVHGFSSVVWWCEHEWKKNATIWNKNITQFISNQFIRFQIFKIQCSGSHKELLFPAFATVHILKTNVYRLICIYYSLVNWLFLNIAKYHYRYGQQIHSCSTNN